MRLGKNKTEEKIRINSPDNAHSNGIGGVFMEEKKRASEETLLKELAYVEDLTRKKLCVYARLLTDVALAKELEGLSMRHDERKRVLCALAGDKKALEDKKNEA